MTLRYGIGSAMLGLLAAAGVRVTVRQFPGLGHVGIMTALARPFRGTAPVLDDLAAFARRVGDVAETAPPR